MNRTAYLYHLWRRRFAAFNVKRGTPLAGGNPPLPGAGAAFLETLAARPVALGTYNQAVAALRKLYSATGVEPQPPLAYIPRSGLPPVAPVDLKREAAAIGRLAEPYRTAARLILGHGLRVQEILRFRCGPPPYIAPPTGRRPARPLTTGRYTEQALSARRGWLLPGRRGMSPVGAATLRRRFAAAGTTPARLRRAAIQWRAARSEAAARRYLGLTAETVARYAPTQENANGD